MADIKLTNILISLVFFVGLLGGIMGFENSLSADYNFTQDDYKQVNYTSSAGVYNKNETLGYHLDHILVMQGIYQIQTGILTIAASNSADVWGALVSAGAGFLKTVIGILVAPIQIAWIISSFYADTIPAILFTVLTAMITITLVMIIINKITGGGET
jgi:hypothetical protein